MADSISTEPGGTTEGQSNEELKGLAFTDGDVKYYNFSGSLERDAEAQKTSNSQINEEMPRPEIETIAAIPSPIECEADKRSTGAEKVFDVEKFEDTSITDTHGVTEASKLNNYDENNAYCDGDQHVEVFEEKAGVDNTAQRYPRPDRGPIEAWTKATEADENTQKLSRSVSEMGRKGPSEPMGSKDKRSSSESCSNLTATEGQQFTFADAGNGSFEYRTKIASIIPTSESRTVLKEQTGKADAAYCTTSQVPDDRQPLSRASQGPDSADAFKNKNQIGGSQSIPEETPAGAGHAPYAGDQTRMVNQTANVESTVVLTGEPDINNDAVCFTNRNHPPRDHQTPLENSKQEKHTQTTFVGQAPAQMPETNDGAVSHNTQAQLQKDPQILLEDSKKVRETQNRDPIDENKREKQRDSLSMSDEQKGPGLAYVIEELLQIFKALDLPPNGDVGKQYKRGVKLVQQYENEEEKAKPAVNDPILSLIRVLWSQVVHEIVNDVITKNNDKPKLKPQLNAFVRACGAFCKIAGLGRKAEMPQRRSDLAREAKESARKYADQKSPIHALLSYIVSAQLYSCAGNGDTDVGEIKVCCEGVRNVIMGMSKEEHTKANIGSYFMPKILEMPKLSETMICENSDIAVRMKVHCRKYVGLCYRELGDCEMMLEQSNKGLQLMKKHFGKKANTFSLYGACWHNAAVANFDLGRYNEAMKYFQKAIKHRDVSEDWESVDGKKEAIEVSKTGLTNAEKMKKKETR